MNKSYFAEFTEGSIRTNKEIITDLKSVSLDSNSDIEKMTYLLCELITKQSYISRMTLVGPSYWRRDLLQNPQSNGLMLRTLTYANLVERFIFELYEEDFGSVRETILKLDRLPNPHIVVYLTVLVQNALKHYFQRSFLMYTGEDFNPEDVQDLFREDKKLLNYLTYLQLHGLSIKQVSGQTNTIAGLYKKVLNEIPEIKNFFDRSAQMNIDLGGGFATPEISEFFNIDFTSFDILAPAQALEFNLQIQQIDGKLTDDQQRDYLQLLARQKFQNFDIFNDNFDSKYDSYNISSFGFLNSTVHSLSKNQAEMPKKIQRLNTMWTAILRIVELASHGKRISLLTFGRPHAPYMNRLVCIKMDCKKISGISIPKTKNSYMPFVPQAEVGVPITREDIQYFSDRNKV